MKRKLSLLLASLLILGTLASCGHAVEGEETTETDTVAGETAAATEGDTVDAAEAALEALGEIDFGNRNFTILYSKSFKKEVVGESGSIEETGGTPCWRISAT